MVAVIDLSGQTFGRLTVVSRSKSLGRASRWTCRCECGSVRDYSGGNLRRGGSRSCGCVHKLSGYLNHRAVAAKEKHGKSYVSGDNDWYRRAAGIFARCKKSGVEVGFDSICDLASYLISIAPEKCPVFDREFEAGSGGFHPWSPSADRINASMGYIRGNIQILSMKANAMKAHATDSELHAFASWVMRAV